MNILGVGITYFPELNTFLESNQNLVNIIEIEPQTMCYHVSKNSYKIDDVILKKLLSFNFYNILHSVSCPVGGSRLDTSQIPILQEMITQLKPLWISEHLSFNEASYAHGHFKTGFFLPPLQSPSGEKAAVRSITKMKKQLSIPFAIENGVNYLKIRTNELSDGDFVAQVVKDTNCGLVLDMHNAWTNEKNGRESVTEFLSKIPLENVWELHLAGGSEDDGYWLDSHSGEIPKEVITLARQVIPFLPNLRAIIFEIEPSYFSLLNIETIVSQLKILHKLCDIKRKKSTTMMLHEERILLNNQTFSDTIKPRDWEDTIGSLVVGYNIRNKLANELLCDPGIKIYRKRISAVRSSMIIKTLRLTSRLLILILGISKFKDLLKQFWRQSPPELFASNEGLNFAKYLESKRINVPDLKQTLYLEVALLRSLIYSETKKIHFRCNPIQFIESLNRRQLPNVPPGNFEFEVGPSRLAVISLDNRTKFASNILTSN